MIYEETFTCNHKMCDTYGASDALLSLPLIQVFKDPVEAIRFSILFLEIAEQVSLKFQ